MSLQRTCPTNVLVPVSTGGARMSGAGGGYGDCQYSWVGDYRTPEPPERRPHVQLWPQEQQQHQHSRQQRVHTRHGLRSIHGNPTLNLTFIF